MNLNTIFLIGPQGSGKGTQARLLAKRLNFFYPLKNSENLSSKQDKRAKYESMSTAMKSGEFNGVYWEMGGILREVAKEDSQLGKKVKHLVDEGILLEDDLLLKVVESRLKNIPANKGVIFDGIPRRLGQAEFLMNFLKKQGRTNFVTLFLDIPKEITFERLILRAEKEGRADDTRKKIEIRLNQYYKDTLPVLVYLKEKTTFFKIDANHSVKEVDKNVNKILGISNI